MYAIANRETGELRSYIAPLLLILLGLTACLALLASGVGADLISKAAGLPTNGGGGFGRIGAIAKDLQQPALYAAFVILPLLLIVAACMFAFGSRQGQTMIVRVIAGFMLLAVAPGLAN